MLFRKLKTRLRVKLLASSSNLRMKHTVWDINDSECDVSVCSVLGLCCFTTAPGISAMVRLILNQDDA